jgi:hypothetical protein
VGDAFNIREVMAPPAVAMRLETIILQADVMRFVHVREANPIVLQGVIKIIHVNVEKHIVRDIVGDVRIVLALLRPQCVPVIQVAVNVAEGPVIGVQELHFQVPVAQIIKRIVVIKYHHPLLRPQAHKK